MKKLVLIAALFAASSANAATVAKWTFESLPTTVTAGPYSADIGSGSALGVHAGSATVYSSPAGNGSSKSFSSNTWAVNDYYQFSVSTTGYDTISLSWDQTGSNTGPKNFSLAYSTNGTSFTNFANYSVINGSWSAGAAVNTTSFSQNLSAVTALNNQANVYFRLVDNSTTAINGTTVASGGTGRVDNFTVSGVAVTVSVPEADTYAMMLAGLGLMGFMVRRRK